MKSRNFWTLICGLILVLCIAFYFTSCESCNGGPSSPTGTDNTEVPVDTLSGDSTVNDSVD